MSTGSSGLSRRLSCNLVGFGGATKQMYYSGAVNIKKLPQSLCAGIGLTHPSPHTEDEEESGRLLQTPQPERNHPPLIR